MRTNVYIDGFNFYYGCYKQLDWDDPFCHDLLGNGPYKWLDFRRLCETIFPSDVIHRVHYCTARVKPTLGDPDQPVRQQTYLRALKTTGRFYIHLGHFERRSKRGMLTTLVPCQMTPPCLVGLVNVEVNEEKGSDVNLATALLKDAFLNDFEQAVVISNDSDLAAAIRVVRVDAKLPVHVISPYPSVTKDLRTAATSSRVLDKALLPHHQLPPTVILSDGTKLLKPKGW